MALSAPERSSHCRCRCCNPRGSHNYHEGCRQRTPHTCRPTRSCFWRRLKGQQMNPRAQMALPTLQREMESVRGYTIMQACEKNNEVKRVEMLVVYFTCWCSNLKTFFEAFQRNLHEFFCRQVTQCLWKEFCHFVLDLLVQILRTSLSYPHHADWHVSVFCHTFVCQS